MAKRVLFMCEVAVAGVERFVQRIFYAASGRKETFLSDWVL